MQQALLGSMQLQLQKCQPFFPAAKRIVEAWIASCHGGEVVKPSSLASGCSLKAADEVATDVVIVLIHAVTSMTGWVTRSRLISSPLGTGSGGKLCRRTASRPDRLRPSSVRCATSCPAFRPIGSIGPRTAVLTQDVGSGYRPASTDRSVREVETPALAWFHPTCPVRLANAEAVCGVQTRWC